jgi:replicative DNA helicase
VPPCDLDAEAAVLSTVLVSEKLDEVRDILEPIDFYSGAHRSVYECLLALDARGGRVDIITLADELRAQKRLAQIGGAAFLAKLTDATPSVAHVDHHALIVRKLGVLRRLGGTLRDLASLAALPETSADVDGFLSRCETDVFAASTTIESRETASDTREIMERALVELDPSRPRKARGLSTGLIELDEVSLGLIPGELWYVAGRTGRGKTSLALGIAKHVAAIGGHGVVFSLEMGRDELGERMLSSESGVPHTSIQKQIVTRDQWASLANAADTIGRLPLRVDDRTELTPAILRSRVRKHATILRQRHAGKLALVVVDYVQLMVGNAVGRGRDRNQNQELEQISRALKLLAKELGVTVLALSQLNRGDGRPTLSDLRGSGALEQDADKVLFVHREDGESHERADAELILAKGRNSGTGSARVLWEPWCVRFIDGQRRLAYGGHGERSWGPDLDYAAG